MGVFKPQLEGQWLETGQGGSGRADTIGPCWL